MPDKVIVSLTNIEKLLEQTSEPLEAIVEMSADLDAQQGAIDKLGANPDQKKLAAARAQFEQTRRQVDSISSSLESKRDELDREVKMFQRLLAQKDISDKKVEEQVAQYVRNAKALSRALGAVSQKMPD